jgi:hypothetical protein
MKIQVQRSVPIIVSVLFNSIQRAAFVFVVAIIGVSILLTTALQLAIGQVQPLAMGSSILAVIAFLSSKVIDAVLQAKGTELELTKQQLSGTVTGFSSSTFSIPIDKIATMHVHQTFTDKLFGICSIVCTQMNTSVSLYGFEVSEAQRLVRRFTEYQSTK